MLVPKNEEYVLHEKKIGSLASMARNLNPLSHQDFNGHKDDIINWISNSVKDPYLAKRLQESRDKDHFVELLMLRHKHHDVMSSAPPEQEAVEEVTKVVTEEKVKKIIKQEKVKAQVAELMEPKKFEEHYEPEKLQVQFDYNDFQHLVFEARKDIDAKAYSEALEKYEKLKDLFDSCELTEDQKKRIFSEIKHIYEQIEQNV
jgi:hypothetical protein